MWLGRWSHDEAGGALVEATVFMPLFLLLSLGLVTLGFIANNYVTLNSATSLAVRQFAIDAPAPFAGSTVAMCGPSVCTSTPYTDLQNVLKNPTYNGFLSNGLLSAWNKTPAATGGITIASVCVYPAGSTCASKGTTCTDQLDLQRGADRGCDGNQQLIGLQRRGSQHVLSVLHGVQAVRLYAAAP